MDSRPVFIFGFNRSGTTLLQRLLNTYDDTHIWGESEGFVLPLAKSFFQVYNSQFMFTESDWKQTKQERQAENYAGDGWINPFHTREEWIAHYRRFLNQTFFSDEHTGKVRYYGFKDPKLGYAFDGNPPDINFLSTVYPEAVFLFIIRNPFNALASCEPNIRRFGWKSPHYFDLTCKKYRIQNTAFRAIHKRENIHSFWISYEDLIEGKGAINDALEFMGKKLGQAQFDLLKSKNGRGSSFHGEQNELQYNERMRCLSPSFFSYSVLRLGKTAEAFGYERPKLSFVQKLLGCLTGIRIFLIKLNSFIRRKIFRDKNSELNW